ncbi:MAG: hypothetical protein J6J35_07680 [Alphaproteobacteria bacterium]|nr:hypothetical protein [Alphaproteobacteria bacterium]
MLKNFENWLLQNNYKPTTAADYMGRIERLCRNEQFTLAHLVENISVILPEYEKNGKKHSYGKRSHYSVLNALKRFQTFLVESKLV